MKNFNILFFILFFYFLSINNLYASAWTRKNEEFFGLFEILNESSYFETILKDKNKNFYKVDSYKFYLEYGLKDKITIGGYIKNYNFYSQYKYENINFIKKVNNDYYSNIFLIQNIYEKNNNFLSLQYSFYFPIKYTEISKDVNTIDTKNSFELSLLYGKDGDVNLNFLDLNIRYYLDLSIAYKIISNIGYDQMTFHNTIGLRLNDSSSFGFTYEYQYFLKDKYRNYKSYNEYNLNKIEFSFVYKFLDTLSTEFSYYKNFSKSNSTGLTFSFIFNI